MKNEDRADPLSRALRELETRSASATFTEGVLARLESRDARRRQRRRIQIALVAPAALLVLVMGAIVILRPTAAPPDGDSSSARAAEIRRQHRMLQEEIELLQQARDRRRRVLYLGANDDYDLVLDLNPLLDQRVHAPVVPALEDLRVRPARTMEAERKQP